MDDKKPQKKLPKFDWGGLGADDLKDDYNARVESVFGGKREDLPKFGMDQFPFDGFFQDLLGSFTPKDKPPTLDSAKHELYRLIWDIEKGRSFE